MGDIPDTADIRGDSPKSERVIERRSMNHIDVDSFVVSDDYDAADLEARADADWGPAINVKGRDSIVLLVEFTKGSATSLGIAGQCSASKSEQDAEWYDLRRSQTLLYGGGTIPVDAAGDLTFAFGSETTGRFAVEVRCAGNFMRFKPYLGTGTATGSRATIKAVRVQSST